MHLFSAYRFAETTYCCRRKMRQSFLNRCGVSSWRYESPVSAGPRRILSQGFGSGDLRALVVHGWVAAIQEKGGAFRRLDRADKEMPDCTAAFSSTSKNSSSCLREFLHHGLAHRAPRLPPSRRECQAFETGRTLPHPKPRATGGRLVGVGVVCRQFFQRLQPVGRQLNWSLLSVSSSRLPADWDFKSGQCPARSEICCWCSASCLDSPLCCWAEASCSSARRIRNAAVSSRSWCRRFN